MKKIAKFEKVSFEQFKKDVNKILENWHKTDEDILEIYNKIELPTRATGGSAGYDFKCPFNILMRKDEFVVIPTGIRAQIDDGWVLKIYPRSSMGFKYKLHLANTTGIIDSDYYNADNEGHIMLKISHNIGDYFLNIKQGDGIAQGVFVEYGITQDDETNNKTERIGGVGSTGR